MDSITEPHGTIIEGWLKGTRCALVKRLDDGMLLIRVFDATDPAYDPAWPTYVPSYMVRFDEEAPNGHK